MKNTGTAKNEVATTSTSSDVTTMETVEIVSSTSVVEESNQVKESESKSSMVEVTSSSREVIKDSRGNIIKVIETLPQTIQQSSSSRRTAGKSSQDFIAGEQVQSIKQAKTVHTEIPHEHAISLSESRATQGETTERVSQMQSQSASHSKVQQSSSSSILLESSSTSEDHSGHRSTVTISHDTKDEAPVIQTSSRSTESTHVSSEMSEAVTKDGQTVSSTTRIRETGEKVDDNGKTMSTSSREVDSERTITPSNVTIIKNTDDINPKTTGDKNLRSDSERSNVEISRCNKPGQSTWDGTFIYEKPATPKGKNIIDKTVNSKIHGDTSETSIKVTQETSSTELIDQTVSSSSNVIRDSKTVADESQRSTTRLRDIALEKTAADTTDFGGEKYPKGPARYSKPGDSTWDGSFVVEKIATQPRQRNDSDVNVFHHGRDDNVVETTQRKDFKERSADGTYEKESSETMRVVKGATDSTRFISEERRDVRESSIHGTPSSKEGHPARVPSPSQRRLGRLGDSAWNGEFIYEKSQDVKKHPSGDITVVRRTEKRHDSVDVQDVSEEQNISSVSESVSASYIVEYATSSDKKNVEKITSVSEVILEEDGPEHKITRGSRSPERQSKIDTTSRCYKPGQSAWDGTFVYERPVTPDRRRPEDKRTVKTVDIRDVTEDNSINEADITSTSYIVEHSSSQQSFSDVRDANVVSTMYETVVYEGHPVETTIRFDDTSRGKISTTERRTSPSPRPKSPEKTLKDRDLRSTKPGSSTWDGTFVLEKSQEKKRPPSRESIDSTQLRPADSKKTPVDTSKKYISEAAINLRGVTQDVSSTSESVENSVVMEQSRTHESYTDSSNLDFSTTSIETVIIRDGQPTVTTQKTVTIQEGPHSVAKSLPGSDVITPTDVKETTVKSFEKKEPRADDKSYRPLKPGSSTWDGSFVYEKPEERRPNDSLRIVDKRSPTKEKPPGSDVDHKTILDTSKDVTSTTDYSTSSVTVERTFVTDSETYDSSNTSKTSFIKESTEDKVREIDYDGPSQLFDGKPKPLPRQHLEDVTKSKPQKSPVDRTHRPSKPGASTWDGSFVYEKQQDSRKKPMDDSTEIPKKPADERKPIDESKKSMPPILRKPMDKETQKNVTEIRYIEDVADITRTSETLQQSSYAIDQSSRFTSVQDVRDVKDERVITEFTTDARKDVVSNRETLTYFSLAVCKKLLRLQLIRFSGYLNETLRLEFK